MALSKKEKAVMFVTLSFLAVSILYSRVSSSFLKQSNALISQNPMMCGYTKYQLDKMDKGFYDSDALKFNRSAYLMIVERENKTLDEMLLACGSFNDEKDCQSVGCLWKRSNKVHLLKYLPVVEMLSAILLLPIFVAFNKRLANSTAPVKHLVTNKFVWIMTFASTSINLICGIIFITVKSFASSITILILNSITSYSSMLPLIVCFIRTNIESNIRGHVLFILSCLQYLSDIFTLVVDFMERESTSSSDTAVRHIYLLILIGAGLMVISIFVVMKMKNWTVESFGEQVANRVSQGNAVTRDDVERPDVTTRGEGEVEEEGDGSGDVDSVLDNTSRTLMMESMGEGNHTSSVTAVVRMRKALMRHIKLFLKNVGFLPVFLIMLSYFSRSCSEIFNTTLMMGGLIDQASNFNSTTMFHAIIIAFKIATIFCLYFSVAESDTYRFEPQRRFNKLAGFTLFATIASGIIIFMEVSSMASYIYCLYHLFGTSWSELSLLITVETMDQYDRSSPYVLTLMSTIGAIGAMVGVLVFDAIESTSTGMKTWAGSVTLSFLLCVGATFANRKKMK